MESIVTPSLAANCFKVVPDTTCEPLRKRQDFEFVMLHLPLHQNDFGWCSSLVLFSQRLLSRAELQQCVKSTGTVCLLCFKHKVDENRATSNQTRIEIEPAKCRVKGAHELAACQAHAEGIEGQKVTRCFPCIIFS